MILNLLRKNKKEILTVIFYIIGYLFQFVDFFYPKKDNIIIFGSQQGKTISGSPKYLYEYVIQHKLPYNIYYYLPFCEKGLFKQIIYILSFAPIFFKAKILISSHPPYDFIPFSWTRRKILINVWHGIPLKCMFFADPSASNLDLKEVSWVNKRTNFYNVSSSIEASLITRCFLLDPRKIVYLGHPRNDYLSSDCPRNLIQKITPNLPVFSIFILYCPTYRRGTPTRFFPFEDMNILHLNNFLERNRIIIFTRGHEQDVGKNLFCNSNRILELGQDVLQDINEILPEVDILITDYSSIYFDFLLCNKPIIFIPYDINEYKRDVGILFDDYDYWTPGGKVYTYRQFLESLEEILSGNDNFKEKRTEMKKIFHYYQNGKSAEKIFQLINDISQGKMK